MKRCIFIVDDHPLMRRGYRSLIQREPDWKVCGEVGTAEDALDQIPERKPDLVIADISLAGGMNGIELTKRLSRQQPALPVLIVSMHDESLYAERALQAGARGYVMKDEVDATILTAIRRILDDKFYVSDQISTKIMLRYTGRVEQDDDTPFDQLTDRELDVFERMGHGLSTRQIAEAMHISPKTVQTYRRRIKDKLSIETTAELVQRAVLWVQDRKRPDETAS